MSSKVTVNVNGLTLVHRKSEGTATATLPDVCKLDNGMPTAMSNVAESKDLADGATTVFAHGEMVAHQSSKFATSMGDEPGGGGGVTSGTNLAEATWLTYSLDVFIEGEGACRLSDKMLMNHGNTACLSGEVQPDLEEDCEELWAKIDEETQKIAEMKDPVARNKVISGKYAEMFQQNNDLVWSGAAAFASKQVGCGLQKAKEAFNSRLPTKSGKAKTLYGALADGNEAVFSEIYPVMDFYNKHGIDKLKECADERDPEVPQDLVDAFEKVDKGELAQGAEDMLRYEQFVTLEEAVYANEDVAGILRMNQTMSKWKLGKKLGAEDTKLSFSAQCDGGTEIFFEGKDLSEFSERWPFAQDAANTFQELFNATPDLINGELDQIIEVGNEVLGGGG